MTRAVTPFHTVLNHALNPGAKENLPNDSYPECKLLRVLRMSSCEEERESVREHATQGWNSDGSSRLSSSPCN